MCHHEEVLLAEGFDEQTMLPMTRSTGVLVLHEVGKVGAVVPVRVGRDDGVPCRLRPGRASDATGYAATPGTRAAARWGISGAARRR